MALNLGCEIGSHDEGGDSGAAAAAAAAAANVDENDGVYDPGPARPPVSISAVASGGEYRPDPVLVRYEFVFGDGTILRFKENHSGDYWGDYPSAGWGQVTEPNGSTRGVDVNSIVRKGGLPRARTPVTTREHGRRMYWLADSEGRKDVKRVDIFEDGWNPLVEGAVLATQGQLGIQGNLASCFVKVEKRK